MIRQYVTFRVTGIEEEWGPAEYDVCFIHAIELVNLGKNVYADVTQNYPSCWICETPEKSTGEVES